MLLFIVSCAPNYIEQKPFEFSKVDKIPPYSIQEKLKAIPKPTMPNKEYIEKRGADVALSDFSSATHVMYSWEEAKKINALKELALAYKGIILEQERIVNSYIDQYNLLHDLYFLESEKSYQYHGKWVASENNFRYEEYMHKWDNGINRVTIYTVSFGSLLILLFAL